MTRDDVIQFYKVEEGVIRSPGKFEDCSVWAPYYWAMALEGFADDDDGKRWTFEVTDDERLLFPELAGVIRVHLVEDDHGFVFTEQETEDEITDVMPGIVGYSYEDDVYCRAGHRELIGHAARSTSVTSFADRTSLEASLVVCRPLEAPRVGCSKRVQYPRPALPRRGW